MSLCPWCKTESISVFQKLRTGRRMPSCCRNCGHRIRLSRRGAWITGATVIPAFTLFWWDSVPAALVAAPIVFILLGVVVHSTLDLIECDAEASTQKS